MQRNVNTGKVYYNYKVTLFNIEYVYYNNNRV